MPDTATHPLGMPSLAATFASPTSTAEAAASLTSIYEEHFSYVWRSLRRMGVPEMSLDDAAQDVFLVVHRRLADFAGRSRVKTWLFGIVLRVARDHRRRARRKPEAALPEPEALPDSARCAAVDPLVRADAARLLDRLLEYLDQDKRAVFVLAEVEQMSAPEIAEALGVNVNTVYSRLRAARSAFERAVARLKLREQGGT